MKLVKPKCFTASCRRKHAFINASSSNRCTLWGSTATSKTTFKGTNGKETMGRQLRRYIIMYCVSIYTNLGVIQFWSLWQLFTSWRGFRIIIYSEHAILIFQYTVNTLRYGRIRLRFIRYRSIVLETFCQISVIHPWNVFCLIYILYIILTNLRLYRLLIYSLKYRLMLVHIYRQSTQILRIDLTHHFRWSRFKTSRFCNWQLEPNANEELYRPNKPGWNTQTR